MLLRRIPIRAVLCVLGGLALLGLVACGPAPAATPTPLAGPGDQQGALVQQATPGAKPPGAVPTVALAPQAVPSGVIPLAVPTGPPPPTRDPKATPGTPTPDPDEPPRITIDDLRKLMDTSDVLVIDVRSPFIYNEKHIKGALNYPFETLDQWVGQLPKDKLVVAYCQWPAENESASVARRLHDEHGFSYDHLKVLLGGIHAWEQAGYPLVYGPTPTPIPRMPTLTPVPVQ